MTWLKIAAMCAMLADHLAFTYLQAWPSEALAAYLRMPGRISIQIFAFLVAYGYEHYSKDRGKYALRLWLFAVLSEPFYMLLFGKTGNALVPLAVGGGDHPAHGGRCKNRPAWTLAGMAAGTGLLHVDVQSLGVAISGDAACDYRIDRDGCCAPGQSAARNTTEMDWVWILPGSSGCSRVVHGWLTLLLRSTRLASSRTRGIQ